MTFTIKNLRSFNVMIPGGMEQGVVDPIFLGPGDEQIVEKITDTIQNAADRRDISITAAAMATAAPENHKVDDDVVNDGTRKKSW